MMRTALIAGAGVFTLLGALFAYNKTKKVKQISRQEVLHTAKMMRQQMYLIFVQISCFVKQNASKIPPNQLRQYVMDQSHSFMKNISQKLSTVFKQFTEEEFQQNVQKFYKEDLQIQYHLKRYQQQFDKAVLGVTPQFREQVVTFINTQKLINLTKQLLEAKMKRVTESIKQRITVQQMVVILRAQKEQQKCIRSQKLKQLGLVGKDQELANIYQFSIAKYCKMNEQFRTQYENLIQQYRAKINQYVDRFCTFPRSTSKKNIADLTSK